MKITVEQIMDKKPCGKWTEKRIRKYLGKGMSLLEILNLKGVSVENKIWGATKFLPDKINREFAIWCAKSCKTKVKEITVYIDVIERYYAGDATCAAFRAAHWAAYSWAAYSVANEAADWTTARKQQLEKLKELVAKALGE